MDPEPIYERSSRGPVLYIRHGQTNYNKVTKNMPKDKARVLSEYLDCPLSDLGVIQAQEVSKTLQNFIIKHVFCSPLHRCLETCLLSLKNHPNRDNIKIYVHPYITEIVSGVHDFSRNIQAKKVKFNEKSEVKFDWSFFDRLNNDETSQEFYFLNFIDPSLVDTSIEALIKKIKSQDLSDNVEVDNLLTEFSATYAKVKQRPESLDYMFKRCNLFKEFLKKFCDSKELENEEKVLVFTHSAFTKISTSKIAYSMEKVTEFPQDCYRPENCEIITLNIK